MDKKQRSKQTQILLSWINHVLKTQLKELIQLWNGEILHQLLSLVSQINLKPYKQNPCNVWQLAFTNSKIIYRSVQIFWTKVLKKSWQSHSYIDLLKFSRQRNQQQIFDLLLLVFGCCVQSEQKDKFIEPIYQFNQVENVQFMSLLQKYKFQDKLLDNKVIQIKDLMTKVEVLEIENDNLQKAMNDQLIELQLLQQSINYLSQENRKSKQELKASTSGTLHQNFMQQSLVNSITFGSSKSTNLNQNQKKAMQDLKAKYHEDKQNYLKQVSELKQTIEFLKDTIGGNRRERGVSSRRLSKGISQRMQTDHPPCVSLVKYQQVVFSQTQKMRQLTKSEAQKKQQIQKLQIQILQLKSKSVVFEKKQQTVNNCDNYSGLKITILSGIKNNLLQYTRKKQQLFKVKQVH